MKNNSKIWLMLKLIIINILISLCILVIALWTSFPYLRVTPVTKNTPTIRKIDGENAFPSFRYDRYDIELGEKTEIDLILKPETNVIKAEVIGAESIGLGIDTNTLLKKGLKIIKPYKPRNKPSKREEMLEEKIFRTKLTYRLNQVENKSYLVKENDYKVFKVLVKGVLPGSYTLKSSTTDGQSATATILTKPEFRIDSISPSVLDIGVESILTIEGRNLDSFTQVSLGNDIEVKDVQASDDGKLKAYVYITEGASKGFRDITITSLLTGNSATLVNGLYVGPQIGEPGKEGEVGPQGLPGVEGLPGIAGVEGMSVCNNTADTLMVHITYNNESPKCWNCPPPQPTSFFDPVLCNLTLGIPAPATTTTSTTGSQGASGETGASGLTSLIKVSNEPDGSNCDEGGIKVQTGLDSNQNNVLDVSEVTTTHYVCNGEDD